MTTEAVNDNDLLGEFNALKWAERFVERVTTNPSIATSEGAMLAWFSGAIMSGYDTRAREAREPEPVVVFTREALFTMLGELALPPWSDQHGGYLGGDLDCAVIAEQIEAKVNEYRMPS